MNTKNKEKNHSLWKKLAREISLVENESGNYQEILTQLKNNSIPIIGITGPPGAGKSSILNGLIEKVITEGKTVGVIAVDPTSPFNFGSLLGDRIRMTQHFNSSNVFIRSLATRGSLGGLNSKIYEITDVMKSYPFDYIFIETVGVGQSEVEIAGLADITILVLVPEAGDEIQTIKSGVMEIANIFVVNKSDREGADIFVKNLNSLTQSSHHYENIPIVKTIGTNHSGIDELLNKIETISLENRNLDRKKFLLKEKAIQILSSRILKKLNKEEFILLLNQQAQDSDFNLYHFIDDYISKKSIP